MISRPVAGSSNTVETTQAAVWRTLSEELRKAEYDQTINIVNARIEEVLDEISVQPKVYAVVQNQSEKSARLEAVRNELPRQELADFFKRRIEEQIRFTKNIANSNAEPETLNQDREKNLRRQIRELRAAQKNPPTLDQQLQKAQSKQQNKSKRKREDGDDDSAITRFKKGKKKMWDSLPAEQRESEQEKEVAKAFALEGPSVFAEDNLAQTAANNWFQREMTPATEKQTTSAAMAPFYRNDNVTLFEFRAPNEHGANVRMLMALTDNDIRQSKLGQHQANQVIAHLPGAIAHNRNLASNPRPNANFQTIVIGFPSIEPPQKTHDRNVMKR